MNEQTNMKSLKTILFNTKNIATRIKNYKTNILNIKFAKQALKWNVFIIFTITTLEQRHQLISFWCIILTFPLFERHSKRKKKTTTKIRCWLKHISFCSIQRTHEKTIDLYIEKEIVDFLYNDVYYLTLYMYIFKFKYLTN